MGGALGVVAITIARVDVPVPAVAVHNLEAPRRVTVSVVVIELGRMGLGGGRDGGNSRGGDCGHDESTEHRLSPERSGRFAPTVPAHERRHPAPLRPLSSGIKGEKKPLAALYKAASG